MKELEINISNVGIISSEVLASKTMKAYDPSRIVTENEKTLPRFRR
ncbi:MAG: hypothetical protein M1393_09760 [Candidatus Thermoplasmatota archaeon]|jgi:hypothetical protein|nr:hypothetical protein [Candidatus Thermoplasmatota archaeon]